MLFKCNVKTQKSNCRTAGTGLWKDKTWVRKVYIIAQSHVTLREKVPPPLKCKFKCFHYHSKLNVHVVADFYPKNSSFKYQKLAPRLSKFFVYPEQWWEFWINVLSGRASTLFLLLPAWQICEVRSRDLYFLVDVELHCLYDQLYSTIFRHVSVPWSLW